MNIDNIDDFATALHLFEEAGSSCCKVNKTAELENETDGMIEKLALNIYIICRLY